MLLSSKRGLLPTVAVPQRGLLLSVTILQVALLLKQTCLCRVGIEHKMCCGYGGQPDRPPPATVQLQRRQEVNNQTTACNISYAIWKS